MAGVAYLFVEKPRRLVLSGGCLNVADYGLQKTAIVRTLFCTTVRNFDGVADTQPDAEGCLPEMIEAAGFRNVEEVKVIQTATGSISIYEATV
jgi:hypothetical protein